MILWKRFVLAVSFLFLLPPVLSAQEIPKAEVAWGYSLLRLSRGANTTLHGWNGSIAANFNRNLAFVTDVGGHYGTYDEQGLLFSGDQFKADVQTHYVLIGPRVMDARGPWRPFAQALFGVARTNFDIDYEFSGSSITDADTEIGFAMTVGGGLDLQVSDAFALRLVQAEYAVINLPNGNYLSGRQEGARVGAGIVFLLGRKTQ